MGVGELAGDALADAGPGAGVDGGGGEAVLEDVAADHAVPDEGGGEVEVLVAAGGEFDDGEVVDFEAPAANVADVLASNEDQAVAPAVGQDGGLFFDAVGVVTEHIEEGRILGDGACGADEVLEFEARDWSTLSGANCA